MPSLPDIGPWPQVPLDFTAPPAAPTISPVEELLRNVDTHVRVETEALEQYRRIAESNADPVIALLMRLILDDEESHHELLRRMAASLRDALYWTESAESLPPDSTLRQTVSEELSNATRARLKEEREGIRQFRQLARQYLQYDDGLLGTLLEMMAADSEKHELVLRFIARRLETQR